MRNINGGDYASPQRDLSNNWHTLTANEVLSSLGIEEKDSGRFSGLSDESVSERQKRYGKNVLQEEKQRSVLSIFFAQFRNIISALLFLATFISLSVGEVIEGLAILFVVVANGGIGFLMERRAESALNSLKKQCLTAARALRSGHEVLIPASELVPGDVVLLSAGDRIPADGRILEASHLTTIESALTGESESVEKTSTTLTDPNAPIAERFNCVFMGTAVAEGRGRFVVTETGVATQIGKIGEILNQVEDEITPLERKLRKLGNLLVVLVVLLCAIITIAGWYRGNDLLAMFKVAISLAIAAVPEGLPAVATLALAIGMQRMARMRTVIRRLPAVETLGSTTIICTDKTGTLTKNEMTLCSLQLYGRRIEVTGSGYETSGQFIEDGEPIERKALSADGDRQLHLALLIGALCNDARITDGGGETHLLGDPTELALLVAAMKGGINLEHLLALYPRRWERPFSSETKQMTTSHATPDGATLTVTKGAVSVLLEQSSHVLTAQGRVLLTEKERADIRAWNEELAGQALRVLALGYHTEPVASGCSEAAPGGSESKQPESKQSTPFTFVGLLGLLDPLRPEASDAVARCREAGIRVVMLTGDQVTTATRIGAEVGILHEHTGAPLRAVHGNALNDASPNEWVHDVGVFARVSPAHKLRIVEGFQAAGHIVAMTGDGVNDAPALKKADIGIAMGITGSDVAKDASDMVITDDNFATIAYAIEQGRIIYENIIRFVHYLFSCNLSEIILISASLLLGWPLPLTALQLLWLNLITDIFPALALVLEPSTPGMMRRPPRDPKGPIITGSFSVLILLQATILGAAPLGAFWWGMTRAPEEVDRAALAMTMAFTTLAVTQVLHAFTARSRGRLLFNRGAEPNVWLWGAVVLSLLLQVAALTVPFLQEVLQTIPLEKQEMIVVVLLSVAPLSLFEVLKLFELLRSKHSGRTSGATGSYPSNF